MALFFFASVIPFAAEKIAAALGDDDLQSGQIRHGSRVHIGELDQKIYAASKE